MPAITVTSMSGGGVKDITEVTLDGSDTLTYAASARQVLILRNGTGSPVTPVIDGDGASDAHVVAGVGTIDLTEGYSVGAIADGDAVAIQLDSIKEYLVGTIAVTSGTGLVAALLSF